MGEFPPDLNKVKFNFTLFYRDLSSITAVDNLVQAPAGFGIAAYPNPSKGQLSIVTNEDAPGGGAVLRIQDNLGRKVYQAALPSGFDSKHPVSLDLRGVGSGVYQAMVHFPKTGRTCACTLIIQR
jgi:hypothetical protein